MLLSILWVLLIGLVVVPAQDTAMKPAEIIEIPILETEKEVEETPPLEPVSIEKDREVETPSLDPVPDTEITPTPATTSTRDCKWYTPPPNSSYTYDEWCDKALWNEAHPLTGTADYVQMFAGVCPSQQTAPQATVQSSGYAAALGLVATFPSKEHFVEQFWQQSKRDPAHPISNRMGYTAAQNLHTSGDMFYDWKTLTISWDGPSDAQREAEAQEMTAYLRSLESRFNLACPNG